MEKQKYVENYAITLTLKQAAGYIISIVLAVGCLVGIYFKNGSKNEAQDEKISLMEIRLKTNETNIDAGRVERASLKMDLSNLKMQLDELKSKTK